MKSFEQWLADTTFPDGLTPVSADVKRLMRMAYEAHERNCTCPCHADGTLCHQCCD